MPTPQEHDYIGLAESSSSSSLMERSSDKISSPPPPPPPSSSSSSALSATTEDEKIKETELRLGLPGSHSPDRKPGLGGVSLFGKDLDEKHGTNNKTLESGLKRGFSDAIDGKWVFSHARNGSEVADLGKGSPLNSSTAPAMKEAAPKSAPENKPQQVSEHSSPPAAKAQVVGWPPIRSYRKNSMASNLGKSNEETEDKSGSGCLYVKVSMDGAPYLRKVDLKTSTNYMELSLALEKMFSCFSIGQCSTPGFPERNGLTASRLMDLLHCSEYVVTYEDKDGDWMLVGDVPWDMFTDTCRRLRIMKGSEAIGLAPRTMEKCKNQN
ncbi:hypothetical protein TIFTF001_006607 [Ficus carica]|uniref:Auxin-responsive protein n=1 Tax=Ficus carica TaxID=3494 RepID=A0AA87ZHS8_FICCA|nr:hypothetical protein TIFTF001_006607 [Ficus carica]